MGHLDMRTLFIVAINVTLLMSVFLGLLWVEYRRRISGLGYWTFGTVALTLGYAAHAAQAVVPPVTWILGGNVLLALGICLWTLGFVRHGHLANPRRWLLILVVPALFAVEQVIFAYAVPNVGIRVVGFSIALTLSLLSSLWVLIRSRVARTRPGFIIALASGILSASFLARIFIGLYALTAPTGTIERIDSILSLLWILGPALWAVGVIALITRALGSLRGALGPQAQGLGGAKNLDGGDTEGNS